MRIRRTLAILAGVSALVFVVPAIAGASVSMTTNPTSTISWTLASSGSNTKAAGSMTISATQAYQVTVTADRSKLTEWITGSSAYASSPKTLGSSLSVLTSLTSGAGVPVPSVTASTSAATIATGVGTVITPANDTYALTLSQPTSISDPALASGRTYHLVLTYTASATL